MQKRFAIQGNKIDEIHKKVADETQKVIEQLVIYEGRFVEIKEIENASVKL